MVPPAVLIANLAGILRQDMLAFWHARVWTNARFPTHDTYYNIRYRRICLTASLIIIWSAVVAMRMAAAVGIRREVNFSGDPTGKTQSSYTRTYVLMHV